ncbi:MAG: fumarylacetoacetate hydrolase family protein [Armatimonadetes bacterium]|nr:fumarylacetoacetate hydrolase family protein [Armatimonadota bacterium]
MKLCRFVLHESPDVVRSGIFHESRVYETQGASAAGIHDLTKLSFYAPMGTAPSIRLFDALPEGGDRGKFHYINPAEAQGPLAQVEVPVVGGKLFLNLRLACVVAERGEQLDDEDVASAVLGYTILINFYTEAGDDIPVVVGPFLVTPEEMDFVKDHYMTIHVNGVLEAQAEEKLASSHELLIAASKSLPLQPGDIICGLPLSLSAHRELIPGQRLSVHIEGLDTLAFSIV